MASPTPIVFMIRHGEKPEKVNGEDPPGLSTQGEIRAKGLVGIFGKSSKYNIGLVLAQSFDPTTGSRMRPWLTVEPLVQSLGTQVTANHTLDRDDPIPVRDFINSWIQSGGKGNVLICWEHKRMTDIAGALGVVDPPKYPGARFDLIWTLNPPNVEITSYTLDGTASHGVLPQIPASFTAH